MKKILVTGNVKTVKIEATRGESTTEFVTLHESFEILTNDEGDNLPLVFEDMEDIHELKITLLTARDTTKSTWQAKLKVWACFQYTGMSSMSTCIPEWFAIVSQQTKQFHLSFQ